MIKLEERYTNLKSFMNDKWNYLYTNDNNVYLNGRVIEKDDYSLHTIILNYPHKIVSYDSQAFFDNVFKLNLPVPSFFKMIDLRIVENFLSMQGKKPESLKEAVDRLKALTSHPQWTQAKSMYDTIHFPLLSRVVPSINNNKIIINKKIQRVHYEIEGQQQGRMSCKAIGEEYINPHTIDKASKSTMKPIGSDLSLFSFDYRHMEVSVLAWLSKDPYLNSLMEKGDFYENLFQSLFRKEAGVSGRNLMKGIFLPLIYGSGNQSLSESINKPVEIVEKITNCIKKQFSSLFSWLSSVDSNEPVNIFGRKRILEHKYQARNFLIHSTAATVCQHKLIQLHKKFKILLFIHDEYILPLPSKHYSNHVNEIKNILTKDEDYYTGLKLKINYKKDME